MKKFFIVPLIAILMVGCIKVEDAEDTGSTPQVPTSEPKPSSVIINSNQDDFTLTWKKNTEGYGQLEITADPSVVKPVASAVNQKSVTLECKYVSPDIIDANGIVQKKYTCTLNNSGVIGSFPLVFPANTQMQVIERGGRFAGDDFEVLSDFYINESHGSTPELQSTVELQANQDDFTLTWKKNTEGYGQLEITANPSTPAKAMAYTDIVGEITIDCKAQDQNASQPSTVKEYECSGSPASMVGAYKISFDLNKQYEIIERSSKDGSTYTKLGIVGFTSK